MKYIKEIVFKLSRQELYC